MEQGPPRTYHQLYVVLLGVAGWTALLAASQVANFGPQSLAKPDWLAFSMFLIVIVAARAMAVRLLADSVVSLDSGFYIAAAVCLGSVTSGMLVGVALMLDSVSRLFVNKPKDIRSKADWADALFYGLYLGGMSGSLLMAVAWSFELDALYVLTGLSDLDVLTKVVTVGIVFVVAHYTIQSLRLRLLGKSLTSIFRGMVLPGVIAELTLLPLAAVVVFLYHPEQPLKFALLGTTFLVIQYAYNRLSQSSSELRERVSELEALAATSRKLAGSLQIHELVEALAQETMSAVPSAEILTLAHRPDSSKPKDSELVVDVYHRQRQTFERTRARADEGLTGLVVESKEPRYIPDLTRDDDAVGAVGGMRSWLGVPMITYGAVEGVLAVQSRSPYAFDAEHLRLLQSIGSQAAVALQNAKLYELAMVDGLTKLYVRRYFDVRLDEEVQRSERFGTEFSVIMLDVDNFKVLNDSEGHVVGDRVLRSVAETVKREMRAVDTAARYGGEEIAIILPRTSVVEAYNQAERIRCGIEALRVPSDSGTVLSVTASFGISSHPESGAQDAETLVRLADRALYRAKRTGKNRVELYWGHAEGEEQSSIRPLSSS